MKYKFKYLKAVYMEISKAGRNWRGSTHEWREVSGLNYCKKKKKAQDKAHNHPNGSTSRHHGYTRSLIFAGTWFCKVEKVAERVFTNDRGWLHNLRTKTKMYVSRVRLGREESGLEAGRSAETPEFFQWAQPWLDKRCIQWLPFPDYSLEQRAGMNLTAGLRSIS